MSKDYKISRRTRLITYNFKPINNKKNNPY